jgi:hypothetical protein
MRMMFAPQGPVPVEDHRQAAFANNFDKLADTVIKTLTMKSSQKAAVSVLKHLLEAKKEAVKAFQDAEQEKEDAATGKSHAGSGGSAGEGGTSAEHGGGAAGGKSPAAPTAAGGTSRS